MPVALDALPIIVAALGASAALVLAVPASPLAQPWSVVGGNTLSTLAGVLVFQTIPSSSTPARRRRSARR
jgi:CBS domain-containing membrane protein